MAILALAFLSLGVGPARLSPATVLQALATGEGVPGLIVREIRLPRALLAIVIGALLGVTGAAMQGLLRNPLAEPSVTGAPQTAALGAVIAIHLAGADVAGLALPLAAILGALASVALVALAAGRGGGTVPVLLAGLAVANLAGAATALVISLAPNPFAVTEIVFWLMGSLEERSFAHVALLAPFAAVALALILPTGAALRAMALGEETAASLGVSIAATRWRVVIGTALGVGAAVAVAGAIGFVGLVAPHLMRPLVGSDPRALLVPSMLAGAALLLAADIAVRLVPATTELKLGVLTALIGAPFFVWVVLRARRLQAETMP